MTSSVCIDPNNRFRDDIPRNMSGYHTVFVHGHATSKIVRERTAVVRIPIQSSPLHVYETILEVLEQRLKPTFGWHPLRVYVDGILVWNNWEGGWSENFQHLRWYIKELANA